MAGAHGRTRSAAKVIDISLLGNTMLFVFFSVVLDSESQAWNLVAALLMLTAATLVLVAVDKPFCDP